MLMNPLNLPQSHLISETEIIPFKNLSQVQTTPVSLSIIKSSAEESHNPSPLEEESTKEEKHQAVLSLTVLDSTMYSMYGVEVIILSRKLKKEKISFIILGVKMTKDNSVLEVLSHKLIPFRLKV